MQVQSASNSEDPSARPSVDGRALFSFSSGLWVALIPLGLFSVAMLLIERGPGRLATISGWVAPILYLMFPSIVAIVSVRSTAPGRIRAVATLSVIAAMALFWLAQIPTPRSGRGVPATTPDSIAIVQGLALVVAIYLAIDLISRFAGRLGVIVTALLGAVLTIVLTVLLGSIPFGLATT